MSDLCSKETESEAEHVTGAVFKASELNNVACCLIGVTSSLLAHVKQNIARAEPTLRVW